MLKFLHKFRFLPLLLLVVLLCSWGGQGHYHISYRSSYFMPQSLLVLHGWANTLAQHASDADDRKSWDPDESPRHYIDIDNYPQFLTSGRIPQTYDSVIQLYGYSFVRSNGILPYAIKDTYDSLVSSISRVDWADIIYYASDIGHYAGDAHMPLHLTRNFDGQYTDQNGIHSRYESQMIYYFMQEIQYSGFPVAAVDDVNGYIFENIYYNYTYVDSVLVADDYAWQLTGSHSSTAYYNALWAKSKKSIIFLFSNASKVIAELIYTAWLESGVPLSVLFPDEQTKSDMFEWEIFPNPAGDYFNLGCAQAISGSSYSISLFDQQGKRISFSQGFVEGADGLAKSIPVHHAGKGIYIVELELNGIKSAKRIIISR